MRILELSMIRVSSLLTAIKAFINCTINNGIHPTLLGLAAVYSTLSPSGAMVNFPREPTEEQATLWWGRSLLYVAFFSVY